MAVSIAITPATWPDRAAQLTRTPTGLRHLVGWFGSTHAAAMWRKNGDFLAVYEQQAVPGFDPQIEGWDPAYAVVEAEVLATASVIVIRLENNELVNGSLGSIAETGMALTSAALRGQIVIVSLEEGLLTSLTDPGAITQYMILEMFLEDVAKTTELPAYLLLHRGNNLTELAALACEAALQQVKIGLPGLNFNEFLSKRDRRSQNYPRRIVLGGSGGPYSDSYQPRFQQKKQQLLLPYQTDAFRVQSLSDGAIAQAWSIPYSSTNQLAVALAMRTLLSIELEAKREADLLLLPLMAEAESKAAATEIGFLLLYALTSGQEVKLYLEPFEPVDYLHHQLKEVDMPTEADEKNMRLALQQAGVADPILALATQPEVQQTYAVFQGLHQAEPPTFKQIRQSLLGQTEVFNDADNIRRVRTLVEAHLQRLSEDTRYPGFFFYSNQIID